MTLRWLVLLGALLSACNRSSATKLDTPKATTWKLVLTDGVGGAPIAGRVMLFNANDDMVHIGAIDLYERRQTRAFCAFGPGVLGTWDGIVVGTGRAEIPIGKDDCDPSPAIPYGRYHVRAWRDLEHDKWEGDVDLSIGSGTVSTTIALPRVRPQPQHWLTADMHVHAAASKDSLMANQTRVLSQVAAGVQVIGLSNHDVNDDASDAIHQLGLDSVVAAVPSIELSADLVHLGVYPVAVKRDQVNNGAPPEESILHATIDQLFTIAKAIPDHPLIQVNHPCFRVMALFDNTQWNGVSWPPPFPTAFDAVEVLNGFNAFNVEGDRRFDECLRAFYTLADHGVLLAPMGNSDTHHLNGIRDAIARTYVEASLVQFDQAAFIHAIRTRHVWATDGPLLDFTVQSSTGAVAVPGQAIAVSDGKAIVDITLDEASFVTTDAIRVWRGTSTGPALVARIPIPKGQRHLHWNSTIDVGSRDTWIGVDATGDTPLPTEFTGSWQVEQGRAGATPAAVIAPILIDANGDGKWTRGRANRPIAKNGDVTGR